MDRFTGFGLIDIFFLILCLRISYTAVSKGILVEILKTIALFIGSVFTFQFYPFLAGKFKAKISFLSDDILNFLTFLALFSIVLLILNLTIKIFDTLFKRKEISFAERLSALLVGLFRFVFLASVLSFPLYFFPSTPAFCKGASPEIFKTIAPKIYSVATDIFNKFYPDLPVNADVKKFLNVESIDSEENTTDSKNEEANKDKFLSD